MPKTGVTYGSLPFDEAIEFFRQKLNMPSRRYDDLKKEQHAKGFMVAGAMKAELLEDLRAAVDKVIAQGGTIDTFRKDFDTIVADYGWRYKGGRNWRTRMIYHTNLRSSHNAGRWAQMTDPEVVKLRPYLMYRHSGSAYPRPQHLAWHGLVLPHDDPFWSTHAPQNGWGCNCSLDSLSRRDLARMGKEGPDKAPEIEYRTHTDRNGVESRVPLGIDPGFDYNVGQARDRSYKVLAGRMETLDHDIARHFVGEFLSGPVFKRFFDGKIDGTFPVAVLAPNSQAALGSSSQTVWLTHAALDTIRAAHADIGLDDYARLPEIINGGEVERTPGGARVTRHLGRRFLIELETGDPSEPYHLTRFETVEA